MGVPALFRFLSKKYPKTIAPVIEDKPQLVNGELVPVDTSKPNPNGEEFDNLYLDMNGIVHPCSHPENKPAPETEDEMMLEVFKYTERVVGMVRPRKLLMIAIDGVAPRAKMNQQRSRRFRSAQEAAAKERETAALIKQLEDEGREVDESLKGKKTWDSNAITPGTPFMDILAASLRYWIAYQLNYNPGWKDLKVILSDAGVPGEGEHKIMEFVRSQRASPEHDPNTKHVIYGLDADLIMLGLATHEPHFRVLREDVFFQDKNDKGCRICGKEGHYAAECTGVPKPKEDNPVAVEKPFIWLQVDVLREYLEAELDIPHCPFTFDLERAIDDWVFLCFFVGNDFLPHLPSLEIREGAIDTLQNIWKRNLPAMGGYLTLDGSVNMERAQIVLNELGKQEDNIFRRRKEQEVRREENNKRRKTEAEARREANKRGDAGGLTFEQEVKGSLPQGKHTKFNGSAVAAGPDLSTLAVLGRGRDNLEEMRALNKALVAKKNLSNMSAAQAMRAELLSESEQDSGARTPADSTPAEVADESAVDETLPAEPIATDPISAEVVPPVEADAVSAEKTTPGKRKRDADDEVKSSDGTSKVSVEDDDVEDTVRLWEPGYKDRYYAQKFGAAPSDRDIRRQVAKAYVEGLCWVLLYYYQGCPSWTWYYPYHYAPFASDFEDIQDLDVKFSEGKPFKPFEQLMGVLPAHSKQHIPEPFQQLMTDPESEILDFYPEDFPIDLNGKKFAWQGVALLPFIDEKRLLHALGKKYPELSEDENLRNKDGYELLYCGDQNKLYDELAGKLYSKKKQDKPLKLNPKVSDGLVGSVSVDEACIPNSTVPFPLKQGNLEDIENDRSISVRYHVPKSSYVHKSMLLRGVKLKPPALNYADKETVRNGGRRDGRGGYGGGGRGRGRDRNGPPPATGGYNDRSYGYTDRGAGQAAGHQGGAYQSGSSYASGGYGGGGGGGGYGGYGGYNQQQPPAPTSYGSYGAGGYGQQYYSGSNGYPPAPGTGGYGSYGGYGAPPPPPAQGGGYGEYGGYGGQGGQQGERRDDRSNQGYGSGSGYNGSYNQGGYGSRDNRSDRDYNRRQ
ncbi:hypothetical protein G7K_4688-t1 [Saitoella complicata NRRL Y-17804]|uniref:5'-3' exoribonuclease n=1 Tax=Saitoella complicata (strain BCRC 22490 / CBS 7301 / JCM 7358 / NBRC 10748 / NRRL Y-17804) TaxID=698492 RepID=A0A0E9NL40_SAICN|nr:hypothetical protein G7K_4688-t1 [Saitoella complicata NRRL Y-17804]